MWRRIIILGGVLIAGDASAKPALCERADSAVESLFRTPLTGPERLALAPIAPEGTLGDMLTVARGADGAAAFDAFLAVGLSRHSAALEALRALPRSEDPDARLGSALALLALGDGSGTATVSRALFEGPVERRRRTARGLALMRQVRPRRLLYEAMADEDPEVRLTAAEVHVPFQSRRARRVLRGVLESGPATLRPRAGLALLQSWRRFSDAELVKLPARLRAGAVVRSLSVGRFSARRLRGLLGSEDDALRAGAFAALVAEGERRPRVIRRLAKPAVGRFGTVAQAQLNMALALLGEPKSLLELRSLTPGEARAAADVLWGLSWLRDAHSLLDAASVARIQDVVRTWWRAERLDPARVAQTFEALARLDRALGLALARQQIDGGSGAAWASALEVLAMEGDAADAGRLLSRLHTLSERDAPAVVRVAHAICGR